MSAKRISSAEPEDAGRYEVSVKAISLNADGHVLALKRYSDNQDFFWDLPGGRMQLGETPADALRREVFEETGDCLSADTNLQVVHVGMWDKDGNNNQQKLVLYVLLDEELAVESANDLAEHVGHTWLEPNPRGMISGARVETELQKLLAKVHLGSSIHGRVAPTG